VVTGLHYTLDYGWLDIDWVDFFLLVQLHGFLTHLLQKLNPPPPDPMQAKIMMFLPLVFTIMFLWFPSGLVLYWVFNNTLSIAQQWTINVVSATKLLDFIFFSFTQHLRISNIN
jgi:membrane protein insertase Oxa1/YidC/SpoIIIJ